MRINVTEKDIQKARDREDFPRSKNCPIAIALKRHKVKFNSVSSERIILANGILPMPPVASTFVVYYDNGKPVEPFSFELSDSCLPSHPN
jgi:hypothetical protein